MSNLRSKCSAEDRQEMQAFIHFVFFQEWEGLKEAIRNGMGGKCHEAVSRKKNELVETISNICGSPNTDVEEIEDKLHEEVDRLFQTWFEDGSVEEIAALLWHHSRNLLAGDRESLRSYIAARERPNPHERVLPIAPVIDEMETDTTTVTNSLQVSEEVAGASSSIAVSNGSADGWEVPKYSRRRNR